MLCLRASPFVVILGGALQLLEFEVDPYIDCQGIECRVIYLFQFTVTVTVATNFILQRTEVEK
jgi:hypothetical protein